MPDWKTRLVVSYVDAAGTRQTITPISSFSPTFALAAEVLHSIEATHIGVVYQPQSISFSLTVSAIGDAAAKLTQFALQGALFDIDLQEETGDDWSFKSLVLSRCLVTSAQPTAAVISGAPSATFSGVSLGATVDGKPAGSKVTIPA